MFISLEGIEGSGKTTQIRYIADCFKEKGIECVITREPGGTVIGEKIRRILLDPENKKINPLTELLLYTADRAQHLFERVSPLLSEGKTVLCDRYFDATLVYQGYARGVNIDLIEGLHRMLFNNLKPDITLLLDLPPESGLSRTFMQFENGSRSEKESRFEKEKMAFHEKVRAGYLKLARLEPDRFRIVDARRQKEEVRDSIFKILFSH